MSVILVFQIEALSQSRRQLVNKAEYATIGTALYWCPGKFNTMEFSRLAVYYILFNPVFFSYLYINFLTGGKETEIQFIFDGLVQCAPK